MTNNPQATYRKFFVSKVVLLAALASACSFAPPPKPITETGSSKQSSSSAKGLVLSRLSLESVKNETLRQPEGSNFKLADLNGKVVLVDIWATYCAPCREQIPKLAALRTKHKDQGLEIVGLNVDEEKDLGLVKDFMKKAGINYPVGRGGKSFEAAFLTGTEDETGAPPIPQLFVFARNGRLVEHFVGVRPGDDEKLEKVISQELAAPAM